MTRLLVIIFLSVCCLHGQERGVMVPSSDPVRAKTESTSQQFVVHGNKMQVRSFLASLAEEVKETFVKEVGPGLANMETGLVGWQHPIVIELHGKQGDPVPARVMAPDFHILSDGFRLQLNVHLARGINREDFEREILELLIYERGLRDRKPEEIAEGTRIFAPPWLVDGLLESFRWRNKESDRDLYRVLFESGAVLPVEELLELESVEDMDEATRTTYEVSAGALVMALMGQDGGKAAMTGLLGDAALFAGEAGALLRTHFPGMNLGEKSLSKWWALQLARMSEPDILETMTVLESEEALTHLLKLKVQVAGVEEEVLEIEPAHYRDLLALPLSERRSALHLVLAKAAPLSVQLFPNYRRIMAGYLGILGEIIEEKDDRIDERLAELQAQRDFFQNKGQLLTDYLNWYQITTTGDVSGAFSDYRELKNRLEERRPGRSGPISNYLDDLERFYAREEE